MKIRTLYRMYYHKIIDLRKFILLRRMIKRRERAELYEMQSNWNEKAFNFEKYSVKDCWSFFRFRKRDIVRLQNALRIPDMVYTAAGDRVTGLEALCVLLRRLSYPNTWLGLRSMFGRSCGSLNRIFYHVINYLDVLWKNRLCTLDHSWMSEEDYAVYAGAVAAKGGVIPGVMGFIDGTARQICRPIKNQRIMYSGHKRMHCTKWQAVLIPNGMIVDLFGGEKGSMHDSRLFDESKLLQRFKQKQLHFAVKYCLYGDGGYGRNEILHKPHSPLEVRRSRLKKAQNNAMSSVREPVEWGFKEVNKTFAFIDFHKQMKIFEKPVNKMYRMAVLLTNCRNCLYPNQASQYFRLEPPFLEEYLE